MLQICHGNYGPSNGFGIVSTFSFEKWTLLEVVFILSRTGYTCQELGLKIYMYVCIYNIEKH